MRRIKSETAEAELLGHVVILGITILGITTIAIYGMPFIMGLQNLANLRNAEQTFTVLDSHASRTVLGNSPTQVTEVDIGGGTLTVVPNNTSPSYIVINSTSFNFTIPMGKVEYQIGDRMVAFEGGGVWSKYPSGTVMLSRPEFNYNGWTLTLPVFNISGNTSVGGKGTALVSVKKNPPLVIYPNTSKAGWVNRTNPVNFTVVRNVYVNITSDFYDGWADYIGTGSAVNVVSVDKINHTASMALTVYPPYIGKINYITNPIVFRGIDGSNSTPLDNFSFRIYTKGMNKGDIPMNKWDIRARTGNRSLLFYIDQSNNLQVGYQEIGYYGETWGTYPYTEQEDTNGKYIIVDLLDKSINLTYSKINVGSDNSDNCQGFGGEIGGIQNPANSWSPDTYINTTTNQTQSLYNITQHYIQKMAQLGDITFYQCTPSGNKLPAAGSTMYVNYYAPGGLTFLDITDNEADVRIS